ncbi:MAG: hypothetical protein HC927_14075 [Deltaproteobacteria bacterium]|nr:hypothetical protein [Deltaproteobacteria bacterium]
MNTTGQWFLSNASPTIGTQSPAVGSSTSFFHRFAWNVTPVLPPDPGACCDDGVCTDFIGLADCSGPNQTHFLNLLCSDPSVLCFSTNPGACCEGPEICTDLTSGLDCLGLGTYFPGATCADPTICLPKGACCEFGGTCTDGVAEINCSAPGAIWTEGVPCNQAGCLPLGACCDNSIGNCVEIEAALCSSLLPGRRTHQLGVTCADANCVQDLETFDAFSIGISLDGRVSDASFPPATVDIFDLTAVANTAGGELIGIAVNGEFDAFAPSLRSQTGLVYFGFENSVDTDGFGISGFTADALSGPGVIEFPDATNPVGFDLLDEIGFNILLPDGSVGIEAYESVNDPGVDGVWLGDELNPLSATTILVVNFDLRGACCEGSVCTDDVREEVCATAAGEFFADTLCSTSPCSAPAPCPGDANGDGFVNLADFTILLGNFGQTIAWR